MAIFFKKLKCNIGGKLVLRENLVLEEIILKSKSEFYVDEIIEYSIELKNCKFNCIELTVLNSEIEKYFDILEFGLPFELYNITGKVRLNANFFTDFPESDLQEIPPEFHFKLKEEKQTSFYDIYERNQLVLRLNKVEFLKYST